MPGSLTYRQRNRVRGAEAAADAAVKSRKMFVPHYDAGVSPLSDLQPTPARSTSLTTAAITAKINAFSAKNGNGKWKNIPRAAIASRLTTLANTPSAVDQGNINACGPALAMYLFARDNTEKFVDCAIDLYDTGIGHMGAIDVKGNDLFNHDPAGKWGINPTLLCDWMMLSSLRRSEDNSSGAWSKFDGSPDDGASGITWPSDMRKWLAHGVWFKKVDDSSTSTVWNDSLDNLEKLDPNPPNKTIVLLLNVDVLDSGSKKSAKKAAAKAKSASVGKRIQQTFPNHYCELQQKVQVGKDVIVWTWGQSGYKFKPFVKGDPWEEAYFGAFICER